LQKWCTFEKSDLQKMLKPLKTPGFRVLADASKLATPAKTKKTAAAVFFVFIQVAGVMGAELCKAGKIRLLESLRKHFEGGLFTIFVKVPPFFVFLIVKCLSLNNKC